MTWGDEWSGVDLVFIDAADERRVGDQFPGVAVVRRIRAECPTAGPLLVVVTGHTLHDGLKYRMAQAKADLFFYRSDLVTADELIDVVLHPERYRRRVPPVADAHRQWALGLGLHGDVNRLVDYVEDNDLSAQLDPDGPGRETPRSRRWVRHRRAMAEAGGIEPVNMTTGDLPRAWDAPSIRQLGRLWTWAARIRPPDR